jgi:adenylate cyclase
MSDSLPPGRDPSQPRTVLLVEDNAWVRRMLGTMLEDLGYRVYTSDGAKAALDMLATKSIDAFLFDIDLGSDTSGIDLCREIRSFAPHKTTPILMVSGGNEHVLLHPALEAGADDFIPKPFHAALVEARLRRHIDRADFNQIQEMRQRLSSYVSDRALESAVRGRVIEPEVRDVSVCFTDIRGFSALSEEMDPLDLFAALDRHLSRQVDAVHRRDGYIDKFGGDGLMAIFEGEDHAVQACFCALEILDDALGEDWADTPGIRQLGIGIHTGRVIMGNIGPSNRREFTAIGATVNLASRLCGVAGKMSIVVSSEVRDAAGEHPLLDFRAPREVDVRGLRHMVTVYELFRASPSSV